MTGRGLGGVPALVLGGGNLALGAIRIFGRTGTPVFAGCARPQIEAASRWYRPVPWSNATLEDNLAECGLATAVLIPTSEADAIATADLSADLARRFPSSSPSADLLRRFADKEQQSEVLTAHGVPLPSTWSIQSPDELDTFDDETLSRLFLKPRDSGHFSAVFGRKAFRPDSREGFVEKLKHAQSAGFQMLLQEYVPGPASQCYLIDGFIDRHGEVRGVFARRRARQHPADFGNSSAVSSVPRSEVALEEKILVGCLQEIGYRGIFNAEFKRDTRDGSFRFFEVNPRTWLYAEFASRQGFDALTMAYRDALDLPVETNTHYRVGRTVIYPYHDLLACSGLWMAGEISLPEIAKSWATSEQLIYTPDDPRPFLVATAGLWGGYISRRLPWNRVRG